MQTMLEDHCSRPFFFMHVPKTAGTAMTRALISALGSRLITTGFDRSLFGTFGGFEALPDPIRATICLEFLPVPLRGQQSVFGHFAYSTLRQASSEAWLLTVLREPFSRLLSLWLYWRGLSNKSVLQWGLWGHRVREARRPLAEFLSLPTLACQTDNILLRMLLWPHPLISGEDFIRPLHDDQLICEARARLSSFAFVNVIENPSLCDAIAAFIGRPIELQRINETPALSDEVQSNLDTELVPSRDLLAQRCQLDLCLWEEIVACQMPDACVRTVRRETIDANIARYRNLVRGVQTGNEANVRKAQNPIL